MKLFLSLLLGLAAFTAASADTLRFTNEQRLGGYHGTEDTFLSSSSPDSSYGASPTLRVGSSEKALIRFSAIPVPEGEAKATLELVVDKVTGDWKDGELVIYQVAPGDAGWSAGQANGQPQNGATCWNQILYADTKDVKTGLPLHTPMAGSPGLGQSGLDYLPAPLARVKIPADAKDLHLTIPLTNLAFLREGRGSKANSPGLLLVAEGLKAPARLFLHSSESPNLAARPALVLEKANSISQGENTIQYKLKNPGFVSLAVYNEQGQLVRELLHGAERSAGPQVEHWDGLDEAKQKLPSGSYTWKLLQTQGLRSEYLMSLGLSVDHFTYWPGNHLGITGLAVDESGVTFGSGCSEAPGFTVKMVPDGQRLWTIKPYWFEAWQGPDSLAVDGPNTFLMQENYHIVRVSSADGAKTALWDLSYDKAKPVPKNEAIWAEMKFGRSTHTSEVDLAAGHGQLAMSYQQFDCIRWIDQATGHILKETKIKAPQGLAIDNSGQALVISEGAVYQLDPSSDVLRLLIPRESLTAPWRISVNRTNGDIWIAEQGAGQQVKRFSAKGRLLQTLGAKGGRPAQGLYDGQAGFRNINAIAVSPDGTFWISEAFSAPRRLAHFDAQGQLLREWYGPQMYANRASADPADPSLVWLDSMWGDLIQAKVDYQAKTWKVLATYNYMTPLQPRYVHERGMWFVRHIGDRTYLAKETEPTVFLLDEPGRRLIPVYQEGVAFYPGGNPGWRIPPEFRPLEDPWPGQPSPQPQPPAPWHFTWAPAQIGDPITRETITFGKELFTFPHASFVRPDLAYLTALEVSSKGANNAWSRTGGPSVLSPGKMTSGIPAYDFTQAGNLPLQMPAYLGSIRALWQDQTGNIFTIHNVTKSRSGEGPFGVGKTAQWAAGNYVAKFTPDGSLQWVVGRHAPGAKPAPGEIRMFYRMAGSVHGCIAINDIDFGMTHVWDADGLWVGRLLDLGQVTSATPKEAYELCGENFGGYLFENQQDGQVYFLGGAQNSTAVYRITGWDQFERQNGQATVK